MIEVAPARGVARLAAVPAWVWLTGLIVVSAVARLLLGRQLPAPFLFIDELTYRDLAAGIAGTGLPQIRGVTTFAYSLLYPAVIAPAYLLFDNQAHAYAVAKAIGALVMSLVAIPTFLLARVLVGPLLALVAATLALAVPFMSFSSVLMTEVAFYPLLALAVYAMVRALERPTLGRQLGLLVVIAAAVLTRRQALLLVPALVTALAVLAPLDASGAGAGSRLRAALLPFRRFAPTWAILVGAGIAVVATQAVRGESGIEGLFGASANAVSSSYDPAAVARWFVEHLADLDVISGIAPFAALLVLVVRLVRGRCDGRPERAFVAASASVVLWTLLVVSAFAQRFQPRLEERMIASLLPLLFVALVLWIDRPRRESRVVTGAAALAAALLPLALVLGGKLDFASVENASGLWPLLHLAESGSSNAAVAAAVTAGAALLGALVVFLPRRLLLVVPAAVLLYLTVASSDVHDRFVGLAYQSSAAGLGLEREWIDESTPDGASVVAFWSRENPSASWLNEFFSRKLEGRYSPADDVLDTFSTALEPDPATGKLLDGAGRPVAAEYAVASGSFRLDGEVVAVDPLTTVRLYRVDGPLRLIERIQGRYEDGYSSAAMIFTRYGCSGGRLVVGVTHSGLIDAPQTVVASVAGMPVAQVALPSKGSATLDVPMQSDDGRCAVVFTVSPTLVPDDALANGDIREVGVRFDSFDYQP